MEILASRLKYLPFRSLSKKHYTALNKLFWGAHAFKNNFYAYIFKYFLDIIPY